MGGSPGVPWFPPPMQVAMGMGLVAWGRGARTPQDTPGHLRNVPCSPNTPRGGLGTPQHPREPPHTSHPPSGSQTSEKGS